MAPVANKDAYYSVSIAGSHQKFLMFKWMKYYYIITVFPDGLTNCPRNSTNLLEPLSAKLRSNAHQSIAYIDDFYLQGDSLKRRTIGMSTECGWDCGITDPTGFCNTPWKSSTASHPPAYFARIWSGLPRLPDIKADRVVSLCTQLMRAKNPKITFVVEEIGTLGSVFPAVTFGPLLYRQLELDKADALELNRGNFGTSISLYSRSREDLKRWTKNVKGSFYHILDINCKVTYNFTLTAKNFWLHALA